MPVLETVSMQYAVIKFLNAKNFDLQLRNSVYIQSIFKESKLIFLKDQCAYMYILCISMPQKVIF